MDNRLLTMPEGTFNRVLEMSGSRELNNILSFLERLLLESQTPPNRALIRRRILLVQQRLRYTTDEGSENESDNSPPSPPRKQQQFFRGDFPPAPMGGFGMPIYKKR